MLAADIPSDTPNPVQGISLPPPSACRPHCPLATHINRAYTVHLMWPCRYCLTLKVKALWSYKKLGTIYMLVKF